jgi:hypothetical protein
MNIKTVLGLVVVAMGVFGLILGGSSCLYAQGIVVFETLEHGDMSLMQPESDMVLVINTNEELEAFYAEHTGLSAPDIDMSEVSVVVAIASPRPTAGYGLEVIDLGRRHDDSTELRIVETEPGPNCFELQSVTVPYHIVISNLKIDHLDHLDWQKTTASCQ